MSSFAMENTALAANPTVWRTPAAWETNLDPSNAGHLAMQRTQEPTVFTISKLVGSDNATHMDLTRNVPLSLHVTYFSLLSISILFLSQFVLAFWGAALFNGFVGLVGFVSFFGLSRVLVEIKRGLVATP